MGGSGVGDKVRGSVSVLGNMDGGIYQRKRFCFEMKTIFFMGQYGRRYLLVPCTDCPLLSLIGRDNEACNI